MIIAVIGSAPALSAVEFIMKEYKTDFKLRYYKVKLFEDSAVAALSSHHWREIAYSSRDVIS